MTNLTFFGNKTEYLLSTEHNRVPQLSCILRRQILFFCMHFRLRGVKIRYLRILSHGVVLGRTSPSELRLADATLAH